MRLCLVSAILALLISIQFQSEQGLLLLLLICAVFIIPVSCSFSMRFYAALSIVLVAFYSHSWLDERLRSRLDAALPAITVIGYGEVIGCRNISLDVQKLLIKLESIEGDQGVLPLKQITANYYRRNTASNKVAGKESQLAARVACGSLLKFKAKLRAPYGYVNPWGLDYEAWLLSRRIDASGYLLSYEVLGAGSSWLSQLRRLRENWVKRAATLSGPAGEIVPALLFGESGYLSQQRWLDFQLTGTIHLLIVSGLHVGFLVLLMTTVWYCLIRLEVLLLFPRSSVLLRLTPLVLLFGCLFYAYMAGMGLAIQRASLMFGVGVCVVYFRHHWSLLDTWLWVILLVLMINPLSALFVGFWFSFAAVGALLLSYCGQIGYAGIASAGRLNAGKINGKIDLLVYPQWVIFIALMPLLWMFQQSQSLLSFVINILAIPLLGLLIMPLTIIVFIWPESMVLDLLNTILASALDFLNQLSQYPSWLMYKAAGVWLVFLLPLVLLALCLPGMPFKRLSLLLLMLVFFSPVNNKKEKVIVFDVGQGLAVYGSNTQTSWLYDTGAEFRSGFSLGDAVVAKNILAFNGGHLDLLFVSHSDNDHAGGELGLRRKVHPKITYAGQPRDLHHQSCHAIKGWQVLGGGARWRTFNYALNNASDNNQSCVIQIEMAGRKILLPGDINKKVESLLIDKYAEKLKSDILIVAHHGSKSSSSEKWLQQVAPKLAVASSGFNNRFHHPHPSIVKRFRRLSIPFYNTARSGAVEIELTKMLSVIQWRTKNSPLWRQL